MVAKIHLTCLALLALCVVVSLQAPSEKPDEENASESSNASESPSSESPTTDSSGSSGGTSEKGSGVPGQQIIEQILQNMNAQGSPASSFMQNVQPWMEMFKNVDIPGKNWIGG